MPATSTIFVDQNVTCSDTAANPGTAATPFCTIQAAVNTAEPGQTVQVDPTESGATFYDTYRENVVVTRSGSPGAPIRIIGGGSAAPQGHARIFLAGSGPTSGDTGVKFDGAHDVTLDGFAVSNSSNPVIITNSSDITLSPDIVYGGSNSPSGSPGIVIADHADHVTVTKDLTSTVSTGIAVGAGVTNTVVFDNYVALDGQSSSGSVSGVSVDGASNTVLTNNTVAAEWNPECLTALSVTDAATQTSAQNDLFFANCASVPLVSVSADSATTTVDDYNLVHTATADPTLYSWAGVDYPTPDTLAAATGMGTHDLDVDPKLDVRATPTADVAADSGNPAAPDVPTTDLADATRVDDPLAPNTMDAIVDRGAIKMQDPITTSLTQSAFQAPVGGTVLVTVTATSPWAPVASFTVDFADGTPAVPVSPDHPSVTPVFTKTGGFPITVTATDGLGNSADNAATRTGVTVVTPGPATVQVNPSNQGGQAVLVDATDSRGPWNFVSMVCDWGDGSKPDEVSFGRCQHTYARLGSYTITVTAHDAGGNDTVGISPFSTRGVRCVPFGPKRLLDTRNGTGANGAIAKVPNGTTVKLKVAGVASIPTDVKAVALNVTVTGPATGGDVIVYPDGISKPIVSTVNFTPGQTVANLTVAQVGADGDVDLSAVGGPLNLVADVSGYFVGDSSANGYTAVTSTRLLDTRNGTGIGGKNGPIAADSTIALTVAGSDGLPASGITAVALNMTVTDPTSGGYITAYPNGTHARPRRATTSSQARRWPV